VYLDTISDYPTHLGYSQNPDPTYNASQTPPPSLHPSSTTPYPPSSSSPAMGRQVMKDDLSPSDDEKTYHNGAVIEKVDSDLYDPDAGLSDEERKQIVCFISPQSSIAAANSQITGQETSAQARLLTHTMGPSAHKYEHHFTAHSSSSPSSIWFPFSTEPTLATQRLMLPSSRTCT